MPLKVAFMKPAHAGSINVLALGLCRVSETLSAGTASTNAAQDGEILLLCSTEASTIVVAVGTAPNGAASSATPATSAGFALPPGVIIPVECQVGDKVEFEAFV